MAQGKGSAMAITLLVCCLFLIQSEMAQAKVYNVGDAKGWNFNVNNWTKGKNFSAGDVLVFNYSAEEHNVVELENKLRYNLCLKARDSRVHQTGNDRIKVVKGYNYFICTFPGHCEAGMKISLYAF